MSENFVYILECERGLLYTGYCKDIENRMYQHFSGKGGARFTKAFRPVEIRCIWRVTSGKGDAMRIEAFIKSLPRSGKLELIDSPDLLCSSLMDSGKKDMADSVCFCSGDPEKLNTKIKNRILEENHGTDN